MMNKNVLKVLILALSILQSIIFAENIGFLSNEIWELSGSNDTLSILSVKQNNISNSFSYSLSYINKTDSTFVTNFSNWKSFLFEKNDSPREIAYGNGLTVVCLDTVSGMNNNQILKIDHSNQTSEKLSFGWTEDLKKNTSMNLTTFNAAFASGAFYFACNDGGLVRWSIKENSKVILVPGTNSSVQIDKFTGLSSPVDTNKRVTGIEAYNDYLVITTPASTWRYSLKDSTWLNYDRTTLDSDVIIKAFSYSFSDGTSATHPLYSIAKITRSGKDTTVVCKYLENKRGWKIMLNHQIDGICFGVKGYFYTFSLADSIGIDVYRDTLGDTGVSSNAYPESNYDIPSRLIRGYESAPVINDILFVPKTDSSGILWVGTSSGLFLSANEVPGKSGQGPLTCIKRVGSVKSGMKQVFASPGVLKDGVVRFVYNLSKDAKVTIRVYDYNMDLVKTIIEDQPRLSGDHAAESGRSNNKALDVWDGTNKNGKTVAPGVYYFKISSDNGDRAFGKIVVAK